MATARIQRNTQQQRGTMRGQSTRGTRGMNEQRNVSGGQRRGMSKPQPFGVDNLTYDLVTILHEKSKGLEALGEYMRDAEQNEDVKDLIQRIQEQDRKQVRELRDCLAEVMRDAK